jgi:lysophospholipase L1-like esterase
MSLALKLMLSPVLVAQALRTRARLPRLPEPSGARQGVLGAGPRLRLLITGDSSAAGVGVVSQRDAMAGQLTVALARICNAQIQWQLVARSGVTTAQTLEMLREASVSAADLAVVVTGVNDVVDQVTTQRAVAAREALVQWLQSHAHVRHVVFAPLPPVHHFPGLPQPLRWVAGSDARRHNAALARWAEARSGVSLVDMAMPLNRGVMAADGFHPGEPVYRYCGNSIAAHVAQHAWPHLRGRGA